MSNCNEIIERLENLAKHAVHYVGEPPFVMSLDDGIALHDAIDLLEEQEARVFNVGDFYGEEFGYLEYRSDRPGFSNFEPSPVLIGDIDEENVTVIFRSASVQKLQLNRMNKNWRIWSEYPTHELLRTVKWDE